MRDVPGRIGRRGVVAGGLAAAMVPGRAAWGQAPGEVPPILFVHGDGESAAQWMPTIWRFESNGWPRNRLFALDMRFPVARSNDAVREAGRSSSDEATRQLVQEISRVRRATGAERLVLVGHGRGGNIVRNHLRAAGPAGVRLAVLCAAPSHGMIVSDRHMAGSEYNGAAPFLRRLNALPDEVVAGVRFVTLLSDGNDHLAQPDGRFLGLPGVETGIGHDGPALRGALNLVLQGADHGECAYSPQAFVAMHQAITGQLPATTQPAFELRPVLNGRVSGYEAGQPTNVGIGGARVRVYRVHPATGWRRGPDVHDRVTGPDGQWGPFEADASEFYEFELMVPGFPITHIYRAPFRRASEHVHLRPVPWGPEGRSAGALILYSRPRGRFGFGRDTILLDGATPPGERDVPHQSVLRLALPQGEARSIAAGFNGERLHGIAWPAAENRISVLELPG